MQKLKTIGFEVQLDIPYEEALENVKAALKEEEFGVLTFIDVKVTLQDKLNIDFRPYAILGVCNPPLANRALTTEPEIGLMLPCNVTVEANGQNASIVRIANPEIMLELGKTKENVELREVALEAKQKIIRVAEAIA